MTNSINTFIQTIRLLNNLFRGFCMVKVGLLSNPGSKRNRVPGALDEFRRVADGYDIDLFWAVGELADGVSITGKLYKSALMNLLKKEIDVLVVNSGDGGHHLVETELFNLGITPRDMPIIANTRGGTINIRAQSSGFPDRNWLSASFGLEDAVNIFTLRYILASLSGIEVKKIPYVKRTLVHIHSMKGNDRNGKDLYGFSYGAGLPHNFIKEYDHLGAGHMGAVWMIVQSLFSGAFQDKMLTPARARVAIQTPRGYNDLGLDDYSKLFALSMDLRMNFGPFGINQEVLNGLDGTMHSRFIALRNPSVREIIGQVVQGKLMRPKNWKTADPLELNGLETLSLSGMAVIEPEGEHFFVVDAERYKTIGAVVLRNTNPLRYLTL
jgi:hypothetical protein